MLNKTLSLCVITKNEEKNIGRCLKSVKDIADEIIVVDTGSTDKTKEIAENIGAKIIDFTWNDDFSAARNKSLEAATMDWILFLDADEEINENDRKTIKIILNNPSNDSKFEGYYLRLVNVIDQQEVGDSIVFRLFRNRPEYRFRGRMHEQIIAAVEDFKGKNVVGSTEIKILHYGYDPNIYNQMEKSKRNIGLLLSYKEEEKDGYYHYSLGNEYCRINKFEEALKSYNDAMNYKLDKLNGTPIYYAYLAAAVTKMLHGQGFFQKELEYIEIFKKACKGFKDIYFQEALVYIERGKFSLAKKALQEHINYGKVKVNYTYPDNNFDIYDIPDLMKQLDNAIVKGDKNLISSVIVCKKNNLKLAETLKSLNEVSKEVFLLVDNSLKIDEEEVINLGGIIIKGNLNDENYNKALIKVIRKARGKYILKLNSGEILSAISQNEIINCLAKAKKDLLRVNLFFITGEFLNKEVRIFKNSKWIKKDSAINKFNDEKLIEDITLNIHLNNPKEVEIEGKNLGDYDGLKILIANKLDLNSPILDRHLKSLEEIGEEIIKVDYILISEEESDKSLEIIKKLEDFSENILSQINNKREINEELLEYAKIKNYDYLIIIDSYVELDFKGLKYILDNNFEIFTNKPMDSNEKGRIISIALNDLPEPLNFKEISLLERKEELFNLAIRAELLEIKIEILNKQ